MAVKTERVNNCVSLLSNISCNTFASPTFTYLLVYPFKFRRFSFVVLRKLVVHNLYHFLEYGHGLIGHNKVRGNIASFAGKIGGEFCSRRSVGGTIVCFTRVGC